MWTEKHSGIHFCGISLRTIDEDFHLHSFSLGCKPYTLVNQTAPNVRKFVDDVLGEYGLALNESTFIVSDNEPKMTAAFRASNRIGCSDHYLNKILEHGFTMKQSNCAEVIQIFETIRTLVAHFRRSHRQMKISRKLQTYSCTRFNGAYYMMNVFNIVYDELINTFTGANSLAFDSIDRDLLNDICEFLKPFDEVIAILSDETQPTLHKVIPLRSFLTKHCNEKHDDIVAIKKLKRFLQQELLTEWKIQPTHLLATIIHPRLREFAGECALKDEGVKLLRSVVGSRIALLGTDLSCSDAQSSGSNIATKEHTIGILSQCYDKPRLNKSTYDEVSMWLESDLDLIDDDLLLFWREKKNDFPNIAAIAREVLAIPASNTMVERLFSSTKFMVNDRRSSLGVEKIDKLMFLKKNLCSLERLFGPHLSKSPLVEPKRKIDDENISIDGSCTSKKMKNNYDDLNSWHSDGSESDEENSITIEPVIDE